MVLSGQIGQCLSQGGVCVCVSGGGLVQISVFCVIFGIVTSPCSPLHDTKDVLKAALLFLTRDSVRVFQVMSGSFHSLKAVRRNGTPKSDGRN